MTRQELIKQIKEKKNFLCVGLDPDTDKFPLEQFENEEFLIYEFNKRIIDATAEHCVAYKPNSAFFEAYGINGIFSLEKTIHYIKSNYPNHLVIADAKRGDIGNTSSMYAKAFFKRFHADAITVAPYMGKDSVTPFLEFKDKWTIVLALTSNNGSADFQQLKINNEPLYNHVLKACKEWGTPENMMFVVGATKAEMLADIRKIVPDHFLLVPGVGAQGGDLHEVCKYGLNKDIGLLINSSRAIIYASSGSDFAEKAAEAAAAVAKDMQRYF